MQVMHVEVTPEKLKAIDCIFDGRFLISTEALVDQTKNIVYPFPADALLSDVFLEDVDGLPAGRVSALILFCLAWRPIPYIKDEDLLDHSKGLRVKSLSLPSLLAGRFHYEFEQPIPHAFHSTYFHVPGISNIIVHPDGTIKTTSNTEITPVANHDYMINVTDDLGNSFVIHAAQLVAGAFSGVYLPPMDQVRFLDGDESNFAKTNVAHGTAYIPEAVDTRNDTDPIYLV